MKKKPKKKYAPGELEKTRRNIGEISEKEAKKVARKLGGEVGIEEDPENILNKYKKLRSRSYGRIINRKKRAAFVNQTGKELKEKKDQSSHPVATKNKDSEKKEVDSSFVDRIRLDFLCSKPEYQLKPISGAIASLFSFILPIQDNINPNFIMNARTRFFTALYDFVTAVRALYSKTNKEVFTLISGNIFFSRILTTIKNWDISGIELELNMLRKRTNRMNIKKLKKLCRFVYYPFGILYDLKPDLHIKEAINWAYNINRTHIVQKGGILNHIKDFYIEAIKYLPVVFNNIKKMFYPLLLKMITKKYYFYDDFLLHERDTILNFLGVSLTNMIKPEKIEIQKMKPIKMDKEIDTLKETEQEKTVYEKEDKKYFAEGVKLLEYLFPKAGWNNLRQFPDLYPYFQPLFHFPPGFELIPPEDSLHQVFILISIIGYLLYGFRHIDFLSIRNERLELQPIKAKIDSFLGLWPAYMNDIIAKLYITRLQDYCRNIEKDFSFGKSEVAIKIRLELNHLKKMFFLPYHSLQFTRKISLIIKKNIPKLYFITSEMKPILSKITGEINAKFKEKRARELKGEQVKFSQLKCESIKNPWKKMEFDLENPLSRRLGTLLFKQVKDSNGHIRTVDRRSNANLIIYTHTLLSMLDYLINTKTSYLFNSAQTCLFRSQGNDGKTPQYSVSLLDSKKYLKTTVSMDYSEKAREEEKGKQYDPGIQFRTQNSFNEELTSEIDNVAYTNSVFSIILLHLFTPQGIESKKIAPPVISALAGVMKKVVRHLLDIPFKFADDDYLILAKKMDIHAGIGIARRIAADVKKNEGFRKSSYRLSAGVIQHQPGWKFDKCEKLINKVRLVLKKQKLPRIVFIDRDTEKLKAYKLG